MSTDSITPNLAGMSKHQLYEIMSQMQELVEQNEPQARQILVQNPGLTRALFQAQIMLGMVRPSQPEASAQPASAQQPPQSVLPAQQPNTQAAGLEQGHQTVSTLAPPPLARKQQHFPSMMPASSTVVPPTLQSPPSVQIHPLQSVQPMGHLSAQTTQISSLPSIPPLINSQPLQPPMPTGATQLQQPMQTSGFPHLPLQPPLPPQLRPQQPLMPAFSHQHHSQMGLNVGFPHSGAPPQMHHSQPVYHPNIKPSQNMGPSFQQAPLSSQPPYQMGGGNSHGIGEFSSSQLGGVPIQQERGQTPWMPENPMPTLFQGLPQAPLVPGNGGSGSQPARPPSSITPEMEKALLQQVMNLTQEQISMLPPEQRNQVLQLQQMLMRQ